MDRNGWARWTGIGGHDGPKYPADDSGFSQAAIALHWVTARPGVTSTLLGVSRAAQVGDNVKALDVVLSQQQQEALDAISQGEQKLLYSLFKPILQKAAVFGGCSVRKMAR